MKLIKLTHQVVKWKKPKGKYQGNGRYETTLIV